MLTALLAVTLAAPVPKAKAANYLPLAVGNKWVWERDGREESEEVTKVTADGEQTRVITTCRLTPDSAFETEYVVTDGVVWLSKNGPYTFDPPVRKVDTDLKAGAKWESKTPLTQGVIGSGGEMAAGEAEEVNVPAGTFTAVPVTWTVTEVNGQKLNKPAVYTYWYADGVGPVKVKYPNAEKALKSFTPGKDAQK